MLSSGCESPIKDGTIDLSGAAGFVINEYTYNHPCALHTEADFTYIQGKLDDSKKPWTTALTDLQNNSVRVSKTYQPNAHAKLIRGGNSREEPDPENYADAMYDVASAYQMGLLWRLTGDTGYADAAVRILNAWASTCKLISGDSNKYLGSGLYGYQFANAAEILRDYQGWAEADFEAYKVWIKSVFGTLAVDFLDRHNNTVASHYWCNWDVANMNCVLAIGILCEDNEMVSRAFHYFKNGVGNGAIRYGIVDTHIFENIRMGQGQEMGRDQGHALLVMSLYGAFCQMAYNMGEDLFAYNNNAILSLCEYTARYNFNANDNSFTMPFTRYVRLWQNGNNIAEDVMTAVSADGRGGRRPGWELIYNHYAYIKGVDVVWPKKFADEMRPEGGGGDFGTTSGGYDALGFGTLMHYRGPEL